MKTPRIIVSTVLILLVFAVAGCFPEKRMVWSPDGKQAAIVTENGLYLSDPDGHLSGPLLPDVALVRWFPDSKRLALVQSVKCESWAELQSLLTVETRERIEGQGRAVIEKVKSGMAFDQAYAPPQIKVDDNEKKVVGLYLRSVDGMKALAGDHWAALEAVEMQQSVLSVAMVSDGKLTPGRPLVRDNSDIGEARISPDGKVIAFVAEQYLTLAVVPVDGSAPARKAADLVAVNPDWTLDGRSLVYLRAMGDLSDKDGGELHLSDKDGGDLHLGALTRRSIINQAGQIEIQPKADDLAGVLFNPFDKVRCLRDGRIIFSALPLQLPVTAADMAKREQIYALDPERQATLTPLVPQGAGEVPENLSCFEVSPDEKRISLFGDKALVAVLNIASGGVDVVQPPVTNHPKSGEIRAIPVWRTTNELSFVYLETTTNNVPKAAQVAVWSEGKIRVISDSWTAEVRKSWLD